MTMIRIENNIKRSVRSLAMIKFKNKTNARHNSISS